MCSITPVAFITTLGQFCDIVFARSAIWAVNCSNDRDSPPFLIESRASVRTSRVMFVITLRGKVSRSPRTLLFRSIASTDGSGRYADSVNITLQHLYRPLKVELLEAPGTFGQYSVSKFTTSELYSR